MIPWMKGGGEDRKLRFCIGAKTCSGKAKSEAEAREVCLLPKEPKPPKARKTRRGTIDTTVLAACVIKALDGSAITLDNLVPIIAGCTGQKVDKPLTRERFIKKCFRENSVTGDIKEAQKLRSFCTAQWKEREASI